MRVRTTLDNGKYEATTSMDGLRFYGHGVTEQDAIEDLYDELWEANHDGSINLSKTNLDKVKYYLR